MKTRGHDRLGQGWQQRAACTLVAALMWCGSSVRADLSDLIERATARATQARDKATEAKQAVDDVRARIASGAALLTDDVREKITAAVGMVRERITAERAGMAEFSPEVVEAFRNDLLRLLANVQSVEDRINAMAGDCGLGAPLQGRVLQTLISVVEDAPTGVLYPLYAVGIDFCGVDDLQATVDALQLVQSVLNTASEDSSAEELSESGAADEASDPYALDRELFAGRYETSRVYIAHRGVLTRALKQIKKSAWALKKTAGLLESQADSGTEATVGIHGYAMITVQFNKTKELAQILKGVAGGLEQVQKDVAGKMSNAEALSATNLILANQEAILQNQQALLNSR